MKTVDQVLSLTEGVYQTRGQGNSASGGTVSLRGFNSSARTLILLDGHPINDAYASSVNWSTIPMDDVETVEVARGPFSSLYGGNALGGVVNIVTRPVERRQFVATSQVGTYDTINYSGRYSDLLFGKLGVTGTYERFQTAGHRSRIIAVTPTAATTGTPVTGAIATETGTGGPSLIVGESGRSGLNREAYRFRGEYTFNSSTFASVEYGRHNMEWGFTGGRSFLKDPAGNTASLGQYLFDNNGALQRITLTSSSFVPEGPGNQTANFYAATLRHQFSGDRLLRVDSSFYHIPTYAFRQPGTGATEVAGPGSITEGNRHSFHVNSQYQFRVRAHAFIVGAESRLDRAVNGNYALPNWMVVDMRTAQTFAAQGKSVNQSAYVQDQVNVTERLSLTLGARYDYWKGYDGLSDSFNATAPLTLYPDRSDNRVTGKVAASYALPGDWNLRLSAGTAFREPNVFDMYATSVSATGTISKSNPLLKPEKVKSWEAGIRKRFGEATNFDIAYYENYIMDLIYRSTDLVADPTGRIRVNVNAGEGQTRGFEAGFRQNIVRGLQFRATYTMTHAEITKNAAAPQTEGKRVTQIPRHLASGQLLAIYGKWTGSLAGRYVGKHYSSETNNDTTKGVPGGYDPFFLADASATYSATPHSQIFVSAENLLNRRFYQFYRSPGRQVYGGIRIKL